MTVDNATLWSNTTLYSSQYKIKIETLYMKVRNYIHIMLLHFITTTKSYYYCTLYANQLIVSQQNKRSYVLLSHYEK